MSTNQNAQQGTTRTEGEEKEHPLANDAAILRPGAAAGLKKAGELENLARKDNRGGYTLQDSANGRGLKIRFMRAEDMESPLDRAIRELALERPDLGEVSAAKALADRGFCVNSGYVHKIWKKHGLASLRQRFEAVGNFIKSTGLPLSGARHAATERAYNRLMAAGKLTGDRPGWIVAVDTLFLGEIPDGTVICLQAAVDAYSGYAFALPHERMDNRYDIARAATSLVYDDVIPFLSERGLRLARVLTDRSPTYCYCHRSQNEFESTLAQLGVTHEITRGSDPARNGLCGRFHDVVQREFFRSALEGYTCRTLDEFLPAFEDWLDGYNTRRPGTDATGFGQTPAERLEEGVRRFRAEEGPGLLDFGEWEKDSREDNPGGYTPQDSDEVRERKKGVGETTV